MRAQTGAFDKIRFHGIADTGSSDILPPIMIFFSESLSSGSSLGELYAWERTTRFDMEGRDAVASSK